MTARSFNLQIHSPKRKRNLQSGWEGFFPYYAGYSESFAHALLKSARLQPGAVVFDPWNGSGTTVYAAGQIGLKGLGLDINPAMVIVGRARLLYPTEANSLEPLGAKIVEAAAAESIKYLDDSSDPLLIWFDVRTAKIIRSIEIAIRSHLVGDLPNDLPTTLANISHIAAANYIALFALCRELARNFYSSNPTWIRRPRDHESVARAEYQTIRAMFIEQLRSMAKALAGNNIKITPEIPPAEIRWADSATRTLPADSVDFVLSSPPYCTRIDYATATRIELAIVHPLVGTDVGQLRLAMLGSVKVPKRTIEIDKSWGRECRSFLLSLQAHPSKASKGYYFKTHLDYFDKLARSTREIALTLKPNAKAVFVVQDSFYKELHNDLPSIFTEIACRSGLALTHREDFYTSRSMSGVNRYSRLYRRRSGALEAVLCFEKG